MAKLVNWHDFEMKMKEKQLLLFSAFDIRKVFPVSNIAATFLLYRYARKGFITRAKRGLYVFPDNLPPDLYVANKLYEPSYISLEFALSYHRVIPENVYEITSVTPKTTQKFETLGKSYSYHRIIKKAFTGYAVQKQKGFSFVIADAEKAFVDTLYFRLRSKRKPISRFNKDKINLPRALRYAALFRNPKLIGILKTTLR
jgi:predicted transcriptional regulator of viral defense system